MENTKISEEYYNKVIKEVKDNSTAEVYIRK